MYLHLVTDQSPVDGTNIHRVFMLAMGTIILEIGRVLVIDVTCTPEFTVISPYRLA